MLFTTLFGAVVAPSAALLGLPGRRALVTSLTALVDRTAHPTLSPHDLVAYRLRVVACLQRLDGSAPGGFANHVACVADCLT